MHGIGTLTYISGDRYTGEFVDGKRQGRGVFQFAHSGDTYNGNWFNDKMNGYGYLTFGDNYRIYEGQFKDNLPCGEGQLTGPEYIYNGKFSNGMFEGQGIYFRLYFHE